MSAHKVIEDFRKTLPRLVRTSPGTLFPTYSYKEAKQVRAEFIGSLLEMAQGYTPEGYAWSGDYFEFSYRTASEQVTLWIDIDPPDLDVELVRGGVSLKKSGEPMAFLPFKMEGCAYTSAFFDLNDDQAKRVEAFAERVIEAIAPLYNESEKQ